MFIKYDLDISRESVSLDFTPSSSDRKLPFYVTNAGHFFCGEKYFTERSNLRSYLLLLTLKGGGSFVYGGKKFELKSGDVFLIDCEQYQYYAVSSQKFWEFKYLHFYGSAAANMYELITSFSDYVFSIGGHFDGEGLIDSIIGNTNFDTLEKAMNASALLYSFLSRLYGCKNSRGGGSGMAHSEAMEKVITYIHENFASDISLDTLHSMTFLSKYHFIRVFCRHTGVTPYEYLTIRRINHAKHLLKSTDSTVGEICSLCGFNDLNNFIRLFKKVTGYTPLGYRKLE